MDKKDKTMVESWDELHEAVGRLKEAIISAPTWWKVSVTILLAFGYLLLRSYNWGWI